MKESTVKSVPELIEVLTTDYKDYQGDIWFRGQSNKDWKLIPSYFRISNSISESTLRTRFKQHAAMLIEREPKDSFDWLFLMQHYGLPTRLLDWSESPLVALYFAVHNYIEHPNQDAVVWCLLPSKLNKNANISDAHEEFFIPSFEDMELQNYTIESLASTTRAQLYPIATIATRNNSRIQAQLGVFTIHHHQRTPIEDIGDSEHITKYIIPSESRPLILNQLRLLGISKFSMFPELSSIRDKIKPGL